MHLKFNSGLNRIGLSEEELLAFIAALATLPFKLKSVYSHLGASENEQPCSFTQAQIEQFKQIKTKVENSSEDLPFFHLLNSSGSFNYPEAQFDAVRTGIGLYGFANRTEWDKELKPIASLATCNCSNSYHSKRRKCGVQSRLDCTKKSTIAVLPIGHADGIQRAFGKENGGVWIRDQWAPIIGNVCMDLMMVDVSEIDCSS